MMNRTISRPKHSLTLPSSLLVTLAAFLLAAFVVPNAVAQDNLDLNIPGLEEETAPPPQESPAGEEGGEPKGEVSLIDMLLQGGWAMIPLLIFSFAVIGLFIFCLVDLNKKNFHPEPLVNALQSDMDNHDLESASNKLRPGSNCISNVMQAGIDYLNEKGFEALEHEKLHEAMIAASRRFNRGRVRTINYFSVLAQAAPMMGLLGTVSGMIGAFGTLGRGGGGDPSAFAGDISEALITTASGLVIALPAIFCYFFFRDKLQNLVADCDDHAEQLMARLRHAVASYDHEE